MKYKIAFMHKSPDDFLQMKNFPVLAVLLLAFCLSGCSWFHWHKSTSATTMKKPAAPAPIVTPDLSLAAKVVSVNEVARFVVLNFPPHQLPKLGQTVFLYHAGLKVAEVKITGTVSAGTLDTQNNNVVADLISGTAQVGDSVRAD
jgi:hypothetical protein